MHEFIFELKLNMLTKMQCKTQLHSHRVLLWPAATLSFLEEDGIDRAQTLIQAISGRSGSNRSQRGYSNDNLV